MYCPSCGNQYWEGFAKCTDCKVPLAANPPSAVPPWQRLPILRAYAKFTNRRPLLIRIVPYLAFIMAGNALLTLLLAFFDVGVLTSEGGTISSQEFLSQIGFQAVAYALVGFTVALSFWKEWRWSRHFLIVSLVLVAIGQYWFGWSESLGFRGEGLNRAMTFGLTPGILLPVLACWYFYGKASVRAYYRSLKDDDGEGRTPALDPAA